MKLLTTRAWLAALVGLGLMATGPMSSAVAQTTVIREGAEQLLESLGKFWAKSAGRSATRELAEYGGEAAVRKLAQRALKEGGEESLERIARLAADHGPDALRALDNAPGLRQTLGALDDLPADDIGKALSRMAAGAEGRALAEAVQQVGAAALRAELRHPGLAAPIIRNLGEEGVELLGKVSSEQALQLARYAPDLGKLPPSTAGQVLDLMRRNTGEFFSFLGRFAEKNPGKILFTAATTGVILANADRILGGDEIVFDAQGNPVVVTENGLLGRAASQGVERLLRPALWVVLGVCSVMFCLWFSMTFIRFRRR